MAGLAGTPSAALRAHRAPGRHRERGGGRRDYEHAAPPDRSRTFALHPESPQSRGLTAREAMVLTGSALPTAMG